MKRAHVSQIFLGNGVHSVAQCYGLHKDLERALDILEGLQQPDHSESESQATSRAIERAGLEEKLEYLARYIYESLTGNEIDDA